VSPGETFPSSKGFEDIKAMAELDELLRPGQAALLVNLWKDLIEETGYGSITLVFYDRRLRSVKNQQSYRAY
jgi:hypothetical protein